MRVISGDKKGHKLFSPKGQDTRPTEDRIKENIFNILGPLKPNSIVLDMFAGTGAIGIEFLSRGAVKVYFVDSSKSANNIICKNLEHTKLEKYSSVIKGNSLALLEKFNNENIKFDYIYIDPPYDRSDMYEKSLYSITKYSLLSENGVVIVECPVDFKLLLHKDLKLLKEKVYRNTKIVFLTRGEEL